MSSRTILLVEDNPDDEALALRAFGRITVSNEVVVAHDGVEAVDYLFGGGQYQGRDINMTPAVILLDLKLPRLDGFEVLSRIRAHELTRLLPVVVLSSSAEESDIDRSYRLGANSYIRKSVDYDKFKKAAETVGFYWFDLNQAPSRGQSLSTPAGHG
jgi:two-component system response regulator